MSGSTRGRAWAFERRWLEAIAEGLAPTGASSDAAGRLVPAPGRADVSVTFETMRAASAPLARIGMRLALWLVALAPIWTSARARTLAGLPVPDRTARLEALLAHRRFVVREAATVLKLVVAFTLLGDPKTRARSGYDRPPPPEIRGEAMGQGVAADAPAAGEAAR
jgi:hypothetical protein